MLVENYSFLKFIILVNRQIKKDLLIWVKNMKRIVTVQLIMLCMCLSFGTVLHSGENTPTESQTKSDRYVRVQPNRIYVRFKPWAVSSLNLAGNAFRTVNEDARLLLKNKIVNRMTPILNPAYSLTYNSSADKSGRYINNTQAAARLMAVEEPLLRTFSLEYDGSVAPEKFCRILTETEPSIETAEPAYFYRIQALPNDPFIESQFQLKTIKAYQAWQNNYPGSEGLPSMTILVSDNGIDQDHEDLKGSIAPNSDEIAGNGVDDDGNGYTDDYLGYNFNYKSNGSYDKTYCSDTHGTNVAGLIGATSNNSIGITGVGNRCTIFPVRAGDDEGYVAWGYESIVYAAVNNYKVMNCSWGYQFKEASAIEQSIIDFAVEKDVAIIVAAGNKKESQYERFYPTLYNGVLAVGEVNQSDQVTVNSVMGDGIDIMAPGTGNYSTSNNGGYTFLSNGTSYAAPVVAGVVGIVRAQHPELTAMQALEFTRQSADDISAVDGNQSWQRWVPRRVNFLKAVSIEPLSIPSISPLAIVFRNTQGKAIERFAIDDTVIVDIKAKNWLGPVYDLKFRLSVIDTRNNILEITDDTSSVAAALQGEEFSIGQFSFVVTETDILRKYFRVDISGTYDNDNRVYNDFFLFSTVINNDVTTFANHRVKFSMCDRGTFGFSPESTGNRHGVGYLFENRENQLFQGGIMASVNSNGLALSMEEDFDPYKPFNGTDRKTGIINDETMKSVRLELTQKVIFNEESYDPVIKIEVTARNYSSSNVMNPSIGYYFDWDVNDAYNDNKIRLFTEAIPSQYTDRAVAHLIEYKESGYPAIGVMAYTDEQNSQPQAASFKSPSGNFDEGNLINWLNKGTKDQLSETLVTDIAEVIGMKFPGTMAPGETRKFTVMVCSESDVNRLKDAMKFYSLGVTDEQQSNGTAGLSPLPADAELVLDLGSQGLLTGAVRVYTLLGNLVAEYNTSAEQQSGRITLDTRSLAPGTYLLQAVINGKPFTSQFIIVR